jgi:hypothetical protein
MAAADPRRAWFDPAHILGVCELSAGDSAQRAVQYALTVPAGLSVRLTSPRAARAASAALARVGYQARLARRSRRCRNVLVSGWDSDRLESRLAAMRITIQQLRNSETTTAAAAIDAYRRLPPKLPASEASARAVSQVVEQIRGAVVARCGIRAPRDPAVLPADIGDAMRLRTIWAMEELTDAMIEHHLRVAWRALAEFCSLRRYASDDWAQAAALRRTTGLPSLRGQLSSGDAPGGGPPSFRSSGETSQRTASSEASGARPVPQPGQQARLEFPMAISDTVASAGQLADANDTGPVHQAEHGPPARQPRPGR